MGSARDILAAPVRRGLRVAARRSVVVRRGFERVRQEVDRALVTAGYDESYFATGRSATGYCEYTRETAHAAEAAYLLWRSVDVGSVLEVGCARGYLVEALRGVGVDASGIDVSDWAIEHAVDGARGHVAVGDLTARLPVADGGVDLAVAFETLEHSPPEAVPGALRELRRAVRRGVIVTIPSFGPNRGGGLDGWFGGKVRDARVDAYEARGGEYDGPVPTEDLARDERGRPVHGHVTIASFRWWTEAFATAGFERRTDLEARMQPVLHRFGLDGGWNLYVFAVAGADPALVPTVRTPAAVLQAEAALGLPPPRMDVGASADRRPRPPAYDAAWEPADQPEPRLDRVVSQACTHAQVRDPRYREWVQRMREVEVCHREQWEWVVTLEALEQRGRIRAGARALGFGVGTGPIAAYLASRACDVVATDQPVETAGSGPDDEQHAASRARLDPNGVCPPDRLAQHISLRPVDMRAVPDDLVDFDITWSCGALEHLGSLEAGIAFVERQMHCLRPGGIAVHTTEYGVSSNEETVAAGPTVVYRRRDLEGLAGALQAAGHRIHLTFALGTDPEDRGVGLPAYDGVRLKAALGGLVVTSFVLVVERAGGP